MDDEMKAAMNAAKTFDPEKAAQEESTAAPKGAVMGSGAEAVEIPEDKENNINYCPTCKEAYQTRARCLQIESRCRNGHVWHVCAVHGKIVESAASVTGYSCSCGADHGGPLLEG
jgi:hypothetical protein